MNKEKERKVAKKKEEWQNEERHEREKVNKQ